MNCNDISLAGCRNNAIVHDDTLIGSGTVSSPLGVNPEAININDVSTTCPDNSMFYADAGDILCTGTALTHDGTTLGGDGAIDMIGANGSFKYDPVAAEIEIQVDNGDIAKTISTNTTSLILRSEKDTNSLSVPQIELNCKDDQLLNKESVLAINSSDILQYISNTTNANTYCSVELQSTRRISEVYQNKYQYFAPSTGLSGVLNGTQTGNYLLRDKDTITGTGIATALYSFILPNTEATARISANIIARRTTATNSASSQINIHANWLSANNWQFSDVGGGAMYDDISCVISIIYNNISNTVDVKIQLPNDSNQYTVYTNLEIYLLTI